MPQVILDRQPEEIGKIQRERERAAYEILNKSEREERSGSQKLAESVVGSLSCRVLDSDGAELHK